MIWCTASSALTARTGCGSKTSPSTAPAKARSTSRWSSTPGRRRVVGWSIADHMRAELVADAIDMATWRRRPPEGSDRPQRSRVELLLLGVRQRLRRAGLLGSMGTVGDALDNAVAESFFASLQCELLDRHHWPTRAGLARAMFHWIEAFYNPTRRHSTLGYLSPVDFEATTVA